MALATSANSTEIVFGIGLPQDEAVISFNCTLGSTCEEENMYVNIPQQIADEYNNGYNVYSLYLNDGVREMEGDAGILTFGGIDTAKFDGDLSRLPIINWRKSQYGENVQTPTDLRVMFNGVYTQNCTIANDFSLGAVLDSGTSFAVLPTELVEGMALALGYQYEDTEGVWTGSCYDLPVDNFVIDFSGVNISVPSSQLLDYASVLNTDVCYLAIEDGGELSSPLSTYSIILGDVFLRSIYAVYDLTNYEIAIAQAINNETKTSPMALTSGIPGKQAPRYSSTSWNLNIETNPACAISNITTSATSTVNLYTEPTYTFTPPASVSVGGGCSADRCTGVSEEPYKVALSFLSAANTTLRTADPSLGLFPLIDASNTTVFVDLTLYSVRCLSSSQAWKMYSYLSDAISGWAILVSGVASNMDELDPTVTQGFILDVVYRFNEALSQVAYLAPFHGADKGLCPSALSQSISSANDALGKLPFSVEAIKHVTCTNKQSLSKCSALPSSTKPTSSINATSMASAHFTSGSRLASSTLGTNFSTSASIPSTSYKSHFEGNSTKVGLSTTAGASSASDLSHISSLTPNVSSTFSSGPQSTLGSTSHSPTSYASKVANISSGLSSQIVTSGPPTIYSSGKSGSILGSTSQSPTSYISKVTPISSGLSSQVSASRSLTVYSSGNSGSILGSVSQSMLETSSAGILSGSHTWEPSTTVSSFTWRNISIPNSKTSTHASLESSIISISESSAAGHATSLIPSSKSSVSLSEPSFTASSYETMSVLKSTTGHSSSIYMTENTQTISALAGPSGNSQLNSAPLSSSSGAELSVVTSVVSSFTTVCSSSTKFSTNGATYTATGPETITVTDCPCTITSTSICDTSSTTTGLEYTSSEGERSSGSQKPITTSFAISLSHTSSAKISPSVSVIKGSSQSAPLVASSRGESSASGVAISNDAASMKPYLSFLLAFMVLSLLI